MKPYREREREPEVERRYIDATLAGDFHLARALFEQIPLPERHAPIASAAASCSGRVVAVRSRASKLDRFLRWLGTVEVTGAWLIELGGRPLVCGFDNWITIDRAVTQEERKVLQDLGAMQS